MLSVNGTTENVTEVEQTPVSFPIEIPLAALFTI